MRGTVLYKKLRGLNFKTEKGEVFFGKNAIEWNGKRIFLRKSFKDEVSSMIGYVGLYYTPSMEDSLRIHIMDYNRQNTKERGLFIRITWEEKGYSYKDRQKTILEFSIKN